jgi:predicted O-linked N-acetylglucosamine transferase (SPINDLY family)
MVRRERSELYQAVIGDSGRSPDAMPVEVFTARLHAAVSASSASTTELNDLGGELFQAGACELAQACYAWAARDPQAIGARANLGRCEIRLGRPADAEARARAMLASHPDQLPGWQLLGDALKSQERYAEAVQALQHAVSIAPRHAALLWQLGHACDWAQDPEAACLAYERALVLNPLDVRSLCALVFNKRRLCDWHGLDALSARLKACVQERRGDVSPIDFLSEGASAELELVCAGTRSAKLQEAAMHKPAAWDAFTPAVHGKLRVGFVSCGFGPHPTSILTSALFEQLHSSAIEVHLFATRDYPASAQRHRLAAAAHAFHPVSELSPQELADKVRELGIEILIDLDGYSRASRPEVFAYRAAPVQVSWLGFPGTTGAPFMDYAIADRFVLPASLRPCFSEKVVYLPRCYQPTDPTRKVGMPPSREACGLPGTGVVYACMNASFKLNPRSFARMLRVLAAVPGSVLWLMEGPGRATERLREAARTAGIDPGRLVFTEKLPHAPYLARYRHADLFLDTEHYNAHTTASDALWADCPVLTRPGETFATRVAGSLNHHLGMDEMNVRTDDDFVAEAIRYGRDPAYRAAMRARLIRQKRQSGLFDVAGYARDFAALLLRMSAHHRAGGVPADFPNDGEDPPSGSWSLCAAL